ncbi:hypothetical protein CsSME_00043872 [Camellia sinensis var. sinensis]
MTSFHAAYTQIVRFAQFKNIPLLPCERGRPYYWSMQAIVKDCEV